MDMRKATFVAALGMGLVGLPAVGHAVTFNLTSDHCTGGCGTPPFGTVTVTQSGANVDISVSLADSNQFVLTGSADNQFFKFNGTGVTLSDITVDQTVAGINLLAATGALNGDGTGNFTFGITCTEAAGGATCGQGGANALPVGSTLTFHVANATIADLTQSNNLGNIFVADILSGTTGNTGPVDVTGVAPIPLPPAAMLFGTALVGMTFLRRRKQRSAAV
jgi:hypothetical protein